MQPFINIWIPKLFLHRGGVQREAHLVVFLSLITVIASLFYAMVQYWGVGYIFGTLVCCIAAIQVMIGLMIFRTQLISFTPTYLAHNLAGSFFWGLSVAAFVSGGMESPILVWIISAPLTAMMVVGKRAGLFWFVLIMLEVSLWTALSMKGYKFPQWITPQQRLLMLVTIVPGSMIIIFSFVFYFEITKTAAYKKTEEILLNILPKSIAERIKRGETTIADKFPQVSVMFADIVGFTPLAANLEPERLVILLDAIFTSFDEIAQIYHLEKIKTIGDCYMIVGGVPEPDPQYLVNIVYAALEIQIAISRISKRMNVPLSVRIGIHTGPAVAGIIGKSKFSYDLWGESVNTASLMESNGEAGKIQVSEVCFHSLEQIFSFEKRGIIPINNKESTQAYILSNSSSQL